MTDKPAITLYTAGTANGYPISIFLEALKAAYPDNPDLKSYEVVKLSISEADIGKIHNQVKSPWFLEINPNGRIPAVTVHGFSVFETSAIILYLAEVYDTKRLFSYHPVNDLKAYSEMLQWIFFAVRIVILILCLRFSLKPLFLVHPSMAESVLCKARRTTSPSLLLRRSSTVRSVSSFATIT